MPGTTEVLLRIEADISDLKANLGQATAQVDQFSQRVVTSQNRIATSSQGVGKAFEQMPRGSAFNLINSQLASMTYQMAGASKGGMALTSAFGILERGAISIDRKSVV
jgi:hypothetical protein